MADPTVAPTPEHTESAETEIEAPPPRSRRRGILIVGVVLAVLFALAGRAIAVYPVCLALARTRWAIPLNDQHLLWWGGLRGALALALALSLPADLPRRDDILISAFAVVAFSVIVQGLTAPVALRALGLKRSKGAIGGRQ